MPYVLAPLFLFFFACSAFAQELDSIERSRTLASFFRAAEQPNPKRLWPLTGAMALGYSGATLALWQVWYAQYPRGRFRFFNDWYEWRQMDKAGHAYSTYFEALWTGQLYRWAGMERKKAAWVGFGAAQLFQTTIEVLDGFSPKWGFSWSDMAFNALGGGLYLGQELAWEEQRIRLKFSAHLPRYSQSPLQALNGNTTSSLAERSRALYGSSIPERILKDYNAQTTWLSLNIASFCVENPRWLPAWLNVAAGYSIDNIYGGQSNTWQDAEGFIFRAPSQYIRSSQYYLSLDVDFTRIKTRKPALKFLFSLLNVLKFPFPALEYNSRGTWRMRALHW